MAEMEKEEFEFPDEVESKGKPVETQEGKSADFEIEIDHCDFCVVVLCQLLSLDHRNNSRVVECASFSGIDQTASTSNSLHPILVVRFV